ncbi:MAG: DNA polymerase IV [Candidatus Omnitrophica bacterium]|nr:DNA polymerase IV [Candidatus Omnitrophota bacterium]MCF7894309.1 DNA polymerase IV [Candidatus Omnitrophota bacterium]
MKRYIVHVDMDAFFAAVEQRDNPSLVNKPVIIGADPKGGKGRGVVSTASYQARKFGIGSAMPISEAYKRCPQGVYLRPNMDKYGEASKKVYDLLYQFSPFIEPIGIDEAFLDITGSFHIFGDPVQTCLLLKEKVKEEIGLTASVGLAPIKMAAKIASDLNKPDGFCQVAQDKILDFLWPLSVSKLWGVGKKTKRVLGSMGISKIGQLANFDQGILREYFGKNGRHLWQLANGIDRRKVVQPEPTKSIGSEFTFPKDTSSSDQIEVILSKLSEEVSSRLKKNGLRAKIICIKIRLENFSTHNRSMRLIKATNFYGTIFTAVKKLYYDSEFLGENIRLIGIKSEKFIDSYIQDTIFDESCQEKKEKTDSAVEKIRKRFGQETIWRGGSLQL